jgi:hypothetical protein
MTYLNTEKINGDDIYTPVFSAKTLAVMDREANAYAILQKRPWHKRIK